MKLGETRGRVFCSCQNCAADGKAFLLVQPLDWDTGKPAGDFLVAADCVGAGAGEKVFYVQSREAIVAFTGWSGDVLPESLPPVDASIVGIVDGYQITEKA